MAEPTVSFIKKSKTRPANTRKRPADEETAVPTKFASSLNEPLKSEVYKAPKRKEANPLIQSSASYRSKRAKLDNQSDAEESDEGEGASVGVRYSAKKSVNPGRPRSTSP